jgi:hypothetical protein
MIENHWSSWIWTADYEDPKIVFSGGPEYIKVEEKAEEVEHKPIGFVR